MAEIWEKQPGETPQAFAAFTRFRDLGPSRSLDAAWRASKGPNEAPRGPRAPGAWKRWHKAHRWAERAAAFNARDAHLADVSRVRAIEAVAEDRAAQIIEQQRQEFAIKTVIYEKVMEMAKTGLFRKKITRDDGSGVIVESASNWDWNTIAKLAQAHSGLGRLNLSLATKIEHAEAGQDAPLFDTSGEIEAAMPPGAVPPMPANTHIKPDLGTMTSAGDNTLRHPPKPPRPPANFGKDER